MRNLLIRNKKILVIGDAMLDIYHSGKANRISPEAPVPVVLVEKTSKKLGGAANVSNNISKLLCVPTLLGYYGNDYNGSILLDILNSNNIRSYLTLTKNPTITKTRIVAGSQQIVRVDFEEQASIDLQKESELINLLDEQIKENDIIVLSDYGKGLATDYLCSKIIEKTKSQNKILIIDPKGTSWNKYSGATIVTPNLKELGDVFGSLIPNTDFKIEEAGFEIIKRFNLSYLLVTRSEKGMSFFEKDNVYHIGTEATEVFDVSGAGDTVVATLATAMASDYTWLNAVKLANKAAGIVVRKLGTEPITFKELETSFFDLKENNKIVGFGDIDSLLLKLRSTDIKIVFTNGCFDIIHKGHIKYLQEAKSKGDILIVGLNSDSSVKRLKGESRPIKDEEERALILSVMEFIDYVVIFSDDTPYSLIKKIKPDVLVKGGDYDIEKIVGREFAKETITISFVEGYSTTATIEKMNK